MVSLIGLSYSMLPVHFHTLNNRVSLEEETVETGPSMSHSSKENGFPTYSKRMSLKRDRSLVLFGTIFLP